MTNSDIVGLAERCEFAANAFLNLRETYNGDFRSQGAANAATLLLVTNATLFSDAADTVLSLKSEIEALRDALVDIAELDAVGKNAAHLGDIARATLSGSPEG